MSRQLSEQEKSLNKKLIPGNVIICLIALIAGFCMLFMPLLDIRIHIKGDKLADVISSSSGGASASSDITLYAEESSNSNQDAIMTALSDGLRDMEFDIPINIYPAKLLDAGLGGKAEMEEVFNSAIGKNGAEEFLEGFIDELAPVVVKASLNSTIDQLFDEAGEGLSDEELEMVENYKGQVNDALDNIAENPSAENAKTQLNGIVDSIVNDSANDISEEDAEEMRKVIDEIVNQATKDGNFDYVQLVKNLDIEALQKAMDGEETTPPEPQPSLAIVDKSASSFAVAFEGEGSGEGGEQLESSNALTEVIKMLENPGSLIAENLDESTVKSLNTVFLVISVVCIGVPVLLCALLALCAFLRIFAKNKRVRYKHVKLIFFISFIIVVGVNVVIKFVLPSLDLGSQIGTILSAFSITFLGSGAVNAICWVVLSIVSLFYYRRIVKKIKRARNA